MLCAMKRCIIITLYVLAAEAQHYYYNHKNPSDTTSTTQRTNVQNLWHRPQYNRYNNNPQQHNDNRFKMSVDRMGFDTDQNKNQIRRAKLVIQLMRYTNRERHLPGGKQCYDGRPPADSHGPTTASERDCRLTFTTIIQVPRHEMKVIRTTQERQLTPSNHGSLDLTKDPPWDKQHPPYEIEEKPTAISVIVVHSGIQQFRSNNSWPYKEDVDRLSVIVDRFHLNTTESIPTGDMHMTRVKLTGTEIKTILELSYSIACLGEYKGVDCDLICNDTVFIKDQNTYCKSDVTGKEYKCKGTAQSVGECTYCSGGVHDRICFASPDEPKKQVVDETTDSRWRIVAIIFIVLTALLAIILLLAILCFWCTRPKEQEQERKPSWSRYPYGLARNKEPEGSFRPAPPPPQTTVERNKSSWYRPNLTSIPHSPGLETGSKHSSHDDRGSENSSMSNRNVTRLEIAV